MAQRPAWAEDRAGAGVLSPWEAAFESIPLLQILRFRGFLRGLRGLGV